MGRMEKKCLPAEEYLEEQKVRVMIEWVTSQVLVIQFHEFEIENFNFLVNYLFVDSITSTQGYNVVCKRVV